MSPFYGLKIIYTPLFTYKKLIDPKHITGMIIKQPAITLFLLDKYPYLVYQILRKNEERVISPMVLQMAELVQKKQTGIINSISTTV